MAEKEAEKKFFFYFTTDIFPVRKADHFLAIMARFHGDWPISGGLDIPKNSANWAS